jgi:hypothetical protein
MKPNAKLSLPGFKIRISEVLIRFLGKAAAVDIPTAAKI